MYTYMLCLYVDVCLFMCVCLLIYVLVLSLSYICISVSLYIDGKMAAGVDRWGDHAGMCTCVYIYIYIHIYTYMYRDRHIDI